MARPGREKLGQRVPAEAGLRSHHMDASSDLRCDARCSRIDYGLVSLGS